MLTAACGLSLMLTCSAFSYSGTLIAAFIRAGEIALFSDGRVIDADSGRIHNDWSKVHQLSPMVGMLTAGHYVPSLREDIRRNAADRALTSVEDVATIARLVLIEIWRKLGSSPQEAPKLEVARVFVFIVGFDRFSRPRLYYLDNRSSPQFVLQERSLFTTGGGDVEIASMSTGSGETEDPSASLATHLKGLAEKQGAGVDVFAFRSAFDMTKAELGAKNKRIGGRTFGAVIDRRQGFRPIQ
jgi:hypothetical protein